MAFLLLLLTSNALLFQVLLFTVLTMYGGGFASLPAFIGDPFGTKHLAAIHGLLLTAWSMAGIVGPMVVASVRDRAGSYELSFYLFAGLLLLALATSLAMTADLRRVRQRNALSFAEA